MASRASGDFELVEAVRGQQFVGVQPLSINNQPSTINSRKGLRANDPKPAGKWIERFEEWLADSGFLKRE